ncbi:hypothetical protein Syun_023153 [Stephania yunnanensis]|uniref:Uncharacterized protein n=1 Tax=Stephania yunnanensis TaxID=152371 RepID=A0AAP0I221_9MAGN
MQRQGVHTTDQDKAGSNNAGVQRWKQWCCIADGHVNNGRDEISLQSNAKQDAKRGGRACGGGACMRRRGMHVAVGRACGSGVCTRRIRAVGGEAGGNCVVCRLCGCTFSDIRRTTTGTSGAGQVAAWTAGQQQQQPDLAGKEEEGGRQWWMMTAVLPVADDPSDVGGNSGHGLGGVIDGLKKKIMDMHEGYFYLFGCLSPDS